MKATELQYGKFQTAVFRLAQELGDNGGEAISRLDTDEIYRKQVAKFMLAGAPAQIIVTADERKHTFTQEIEILEKARGLVPAEVARLYYKETGRWPEVDWENARPGFLKQMARNYWFDTRITCEIDNCHALAKVLNTTPDRLQRLNQQFTKPIQVELDPRLPLKDFIGKIPADVTTLGRLLVWLSKSGEEG
jgi:hypothetical protein